MSAHWTDAAAAELDRLKGGAAAWPYRVGNLPAVEPTVIAALALLAHAARGSELDAGSPSARPDRKEKTHGIAAVASDWIARLQQLDGAVGVSTNLTEPGWCTSFAILLWAAASGFESQRQLASNWLRNRQGIHFPRKAGSPMAHDTSIHGWPWVTNTHSWVEPTSMAILALRSEGQGGDPRVVEGMSMIRDRVVPSGGWNWGNSAVFDRELRPRPMPTGLALLALAGVDAPDAPHISKSIGYLAHELEQVRAAASLSWGLLGLAAWGKSPQNADEWLAASFESVRKRPEAPLLVGHLLLAAEPRSLALLGVKPMAGNGKHG